MFRKIVISVSFLLVVAAMVTVAMTQDKDVLDRFTAKLEDSRISFDYTYTADEGKLQLTGEGSVVAQDSTYYIEAEGLRIWCDGQALWTVDDNAKEAVVEKLSSETYTAVVNPLALLKNINEDFDSSKTPEAEFYSQKCLKYTLKPRFADEFQSIVLYFDKGNETLAGAEVQTEKAILTFRLCNVVFATPSSMSQYDLSQLDSSYFITDLR